MKIQDSVAPWPRMREAGAGPICCSAYQQVEGTCPKSLQSWVGGIVFQLRYFFLQYEGRTKVLSVWIYRLLESTAQRKLHFDKLSISRDLVGR